MTERERLILTGKKIDPATADEAAISTAIKNAGSGGGGSLPEPGTAGNVLTSDGTAWESSAPPANEYPVVFTFNGATVTCNKTIAEIKAAISAGKTVKGYGAGDWSNAVFDLSVSVPGNDELSMFVFTASFNSDESAGTGYTISVYCTAVSGADDDFKYYLVVNSELPTTTGNNGKVLGVVDGVYALISPSALSNAPLYVAISQTGNTLSTDKTAAEITAALDAGKAVSLRMKVIQDEGSAEEETMWSEKTLVGVDHVAATGYTLIYVEYDGDTDTWTKVTMTAATSADVFSYTPSNP